MFSKKEFRTHLRYRWWAYAVLAVGCILLWTTLFPIASRTLPYERVQITSIGAEFDAAVVETDLTAALPELTEQRLKDIGVEQMAYTDDYSMGIVLYSRSNGLSDLLILTDYALNHEIIFTNYFAALDEAKIREYFGEDAEIWYEDGIAYGIRADGNTRFGSYLAKDEPCWLFVTLTGENAGAWNGQGLPEHDAALLAARYLLEEVK